MEGDYAAFVSAAYGLSFLALAGLGFWIFLDGRGVRGALKGLEDQGLKRRSDRGAER